MLYLSFQDNHCIHSTVVEYEYKHFLFISKNLRYVNKFVDFYGLWYEGKLLNAYQMMHILLCLRNVSR